MRIIYRSSVSFLLFDRKAKERREGERERIETIVCLFMLTISKTSIGKKNVRDNRTAWSNQVQWSTQLVGRKRERGEKERVKRKKKKITRLKISDKRDKSQGKPTSRSPVMSIITISVRIGDDRRTRRKRFADAVQMPSSFSFLSLNWNRSIWR